MKDKNTEEKHLTTIHKSIKQNQKNKYPVIERKGHSTKQETFKTTEKISETKEEKLRIRHRRLNKKFQMPTRRFLFLKLVRMIFEIPEIIQAETTA